MTERQWQELFDSIKTELDEHWEVTVRLLDTRGMVSVKANGRETAWRLNDD